MSTEQQPRYTITQRMGTANTVLNGVPFACGNCLSPIKRSYTWYVNQHSAKYRLFCDRCNQWEDITAIFETGEYKHRIVKAGE